MYYCTSCDMNVLLLNGGCGNACGSRRCSHSKVNSRSKASKLSCTRFKTITYFLHCREDGNAAYQEGKHELAILLYTEAMRSVITARSPATPSKSSDSMSCQPCFDDALQPCVMFSVTHLQPFVNVQPMP